MLPIVISFYTANWKYSEHAARLKAECEELGLEYLIEERPDRGDYLANCRQKPAFIAECLEKLKRPVLWIDVDGSIYKRPELFENIDADFAAFPKEQGDRRWYVCTLYFGPGALSFVQAWAAMCKDWSDESALHDLWLTKPEIKTFVLPQSYSCMEGCDCDGAVIRHRLSKSEQKKEFYRGLR